MSSQRLYKYDLSHLLPCLAIFLYLPGFQFVLGPSLLRLLNSYPEIPTDLISTLMGKKHYQVGASRWQGELEK